VKRVVVTGASGVIGGALCELLLARGWEVLALGRRPEALAALKSAARSAPLNVAALELDGCDGDALAALLDSLGWRVISGLVNVAGLSVGGEIVDVSRDDWARSLNVNLTAPMLFTQVCAARMGAGASIVNVSSPVAVIGARKVSYAASKAALHGLTVSCARSLGARGVRVNLVLPGATLTRMTSHWTPEKRTRVAQESFLGRLCAPHEVAAAIAFLLSEDASFITGATLDVTGGALWRA